MRKSLSIFLFFINLIIVTSCNSSDINQNRKEVKKVTQKLDVNISMYANYNLWANTEFVNWLKELDSTILVTETPSSFPTIRETLIHLLGAETGWSSPLTKTEWKKLDDSVNELSNEAIMDELIKASDNIRNTVSNLVLTDVNSYLDSMEYFYNAEGIIMHVCNHSTQHRGQIITMARSLGITNPPRTDLIYYLKTLED